MHARLESVIDCCQQAIQKDAWTLQDEIAIQSCIHEELSSIDNAIDRHRFRTEVMAQVQEILLIQKYRAVYLKGVPQGFEKERFLRKIDEAFYSTIG